MGANYNGGKKTVSQTWVISKNGYGYHNVSAETQTAAEDAGIAIFSFGKKDNNGKKPSDKPTGSNVKKTSKNSKPFIPLASR